MKTKRIFIWFLAGYLMVHFFLSIGILIVQDNLTAGMVGIELVKLFFQLLWICLFLIPAGIWKQSNGFLADPSPQKQRTVGGSVSHVSENASESSEPFQIIL